MAGFDPDAYIEAKSKKAPAFDPDAYLQMKGVKPEGPGILSGMGQVLADDADAVQRVGRNIPVLGPLAVKGGNALAAGIDAAVHGVGKGDSYLDRAKDAYGKFTAQDLAREEAYAKEHPNIAMAENLAGSALVPIPGAQLSGLGGIAARVGGSAAIQGADVLARGGDAATAGKAAGITGGIAAGIEGLPYVGKVAGPAARKLADSPVGQYVAQKMSQAGETLSNAATAEKLGSLGEKFGTVAGGSMGWGIGSKFNHVGGSVLAGAGATIGNKAGGALGRKVGQAVETYGPSIMERLENAPETLGRYAAPLMSASARGPQAVAAAHYVMSQNDPEYQKLFQEGQ